MQIAKIIMTNNSSSYHDQQLSPSSINMIQNYAEINHVKQLSTDIGNLFNNTDYCDIKLVIDGVEFKAHKIILAARSEYFRALLFSGMKESNSDQIEIKEAKPDAFRLLLQYIYTGKISLKNQKEELLIDLLGLVHQYGFIELQKGVSDYLESIIDIKNVCNIYDIACLYNLTSLAESSARFIDKNCSQLIKSSGLLSLSYESLSAIIARDSFCAAEIEIFNLVKEWHDQYNLNKETFEIKDELVNKIRLPLMQLNELFNDVRNSNLLSADVILDAIKMKHEAKLMDLKHRGFLYPNENIATNKYNASVIKGEFKSALLDGDVINYDFDRGFTYHPIDDNSGQNNAIIVKLGSPSIFNQIKLLLWDKDNRSYSYYIEVSMNEEDWTRVIDYTDYLCRSWQNLYFKDVVAQYIKIVGNRNTANRIFHLVSMEVRYSFRKYNLFNDLIVPNYNVASIEQSACVLEGVSRSRNALINGDYKNYDWDSGYTCHQLGSGAITIQLAQPYIIGSMRLLLWDCDSRTYSYYIETSLDQTNWSIVVDKRNESCSSWQILTFKPRPISFIKIIGTHNTANEVFHCVHFESPCDNDVLNRYLDQQQQNIEQQQSTITTANNDNNNNNNNNNNSSNSNNNNNNNNNNSKSTITSSPEPNTDTNNNSNNKNVVSTVDAKTSEEDNDNNQKQE